MRISCVIRLLVIVAVSCAAIQFVDVGNELLRLVVDYKKQSCLSKDALFGLNWAYKILMGCASQKARDTNSNRLYWNIVHDVKGLKQRTPSEELSVNGQIVLKGMANDSELWHHSIKFSLLDVVISTINMSDYEVLVDQGLPSAIESDECIAQLIASKLCVVSSKCMNMMTSNEPTYGYHRTHRLLFFLFLSLKQCEHYLPFDTSLDMIIWEQCSNIYTEQYIIKENSIPPDYRDLFIEQSLLCGMAGYFEFLEVNAVKQVIHLNHGITAFKETKSSHEVMEHTRSLFLTFYSNILALIY